MTPTTFPCPFCGKKMGVGPDLLGKQVRCPHCKQVIVAPAPAAPAAPLVAPVAVAVPGTAESPPLPPPPLTPPTVKLTAPSPSPGLSPELPVFNLPSAEEQESIFGQQAEQGDDLFGDAPAKPQAPVMPPPIPAPVPPPNPFAQYAAPAPPPVAPPAPVYPPPLPPVPENPFAGFAAAAPAPVPVPVPPPAPAPVPVPVPVPTPAAVTFPPPRPVAAAPANPWEGFAPPPPAPTYAPPAPAAVYPPPAPAPTYAPPEPAAFPAPQPVPADLPAELPDEPAPAPRRAPERGRAAKPAAGGGKGMTIALAGLGAYALVMTGLAVYGLFIRDGGKLPPDHPLSLIPDRPGAYPPADGKNSGKLGFKADGALPPELRTGLGKTVAIGAVEVTPLRVEVKPLVIVKDLPNGGDTRMNPAPGVALTLRVKNTSADLTFHPLDPAFNPKAYPGVDPGPTRLVVGKETFAGGPVTWPFEKGTKRVYEESQKGEDVPLKPGEAREYVVASALSPSLVRAVKGAKDGATWRVLVRRGPVEFRGREVPVAAVIGVEFTAADVRAE